jgi:hypothetical protein
MAKKLPKAELEKLPGCAAEFIRLVIKKMRYRKKVRADVMATRRERKRPGSWLQSSAMPNCWGFCFAGLRSDAGHCGVQWR